MSDVLAPRLRYKASILKTFFMINCRKNVNYEENCLKLAYQTYFEEISTGTCWFQFYTSTDAHLGMFVTTGCSSRRQFVATASRQDTSSRQQNTDSGRQVTASGQFHKPSQTQESKYGSYALLLLCRLKWKNGSTFNERNFM